MRWIQHKRARSVPKREAKHIHPDSAAMSVMVPRGCALHTHGDVRVGMGVPYQGWVTLSGAGYAWFAPSDGPDQDTHLMWRAEE